MNDDEYTIVSEEGPFGRQAEGTIVIVRTDKGTFAERLDRLCAKEIMRMSEDKGVVNDAAVKDVVRSLMTCGFFHISFVPPDERRGIIDEANAEATRLLERLMEDKKEGSRC